VPLYVERYMFVTADAKRFAGRDTIGWAEANNEHLCLLTPDMQNRRIINHYMSMCGIEAKPVMETDSIIAMVTHVLAGSWSGIIPEKLADMFLQTGNIKAIPLVEPEGLQLVGAVAAEREPHTPLVEALLRHARAYWRTD